MSAPTPPTAPVPVSAVEVSPAELVMLRASQDGWLVQAVDVLNSDRPRWALLTTTRAAEDAPRAVAALVADLINRGLISATGRTGLVRWYSGTALVSWVVPTAAGHRILTGGAA